MLAFGAAFLWDAIQSIRSGGIESNMVHLGRALRFYSRESTPIRWVAATVIHLLFGCTAAGLGVLMLVDGSPIERLTSLSVALAAGTAYLLLVRWDVPVPLEPVAAPTDPVHADYRRAPAQAAPQRFAVPSEARRRFVISLTLGLATLVLAIVEAIGAALLEPDTTPFTWGTMAISAIIGVAATLISLRRWSRLRASVL
jgi:hypothetical protein